MTAYGQHPAPHNCELTAPNQLGPGVSWTCWCGQRWSTRNANDLFTGGPITIWARTNGWNLAQYWRDRRRQKARP